MYWLGVNFILLLLRIFYRHRTYGMDNVPAEGGVILVPNHVSFLDPPSVGTPVKRRVSFLARGSLAENWFYRLGTKIFDIIPIRRSGGDRAAINTLVDLLRKGKACALFPEGTRSPDGKLKEFKQGFALIAEKGGVPVVPVLVDGTYGIWPKNRRFPRLQGRIRVRYGKAINIGPGGRSELASRVRDEIRRMAVEWGLSIDGSSDGSSSEGSSQDGSSHGGEVSNKARAEQGFMLASDGIPTLGVRSLC